MLSTRPKVAEMAFQLFGRALHPELFEVQQVRTFERGGYSAKVEITTSGHLVTWRYEGMTLTEVACSSHHPLPQKRRLMTYRMKGDREDHVDCRGGVKYVVRLQLEKVNPEIFWMFQQELSRDSNCRGLVHRFASSGRVAAGAMSYVNAEMRSKSLLIQAFHTFPDDCAIVKSQSQFLLP